jgi:hypothetical protein
MTDNGTSEIPGHRTNHANRLSGPAHPAGGVLANWQLANHRDRLDRQEDLPDI